MKAPDRLHNILKRYRIACSMKIKLSMNEPKTFKIIINKNLVHVQVHFLKIELVHVKFTQYLKKNVSNDVTFGRYGRVNPAYL